MTAPQCCGKLMICADPNTTGYYPYMPHRCQSCGSVTYAKVGDYKDRVMTQVYDSTQDTLNHIEKVRGYLFDVEKELLIRGAIHDQSKLKSPEKEAHDRVNPRLRAAKFGSNEYLAAVADMGEAVQHHYANNRHHPEHFADGIDGMNLLDVVEMLCDWKAATDRNNGDLAKSIDINAERFGIGEQLAVVLRNTARDMGWSG